MPLLVYGTYHVQLEDGANHNSKHLVSFQFYPVGLIVVLTSLMGMIGLYRYPGLFDAAYGRRKLWALLPGALGIVFLYMAPAWLQLAIFPLLLPTGVLLVWRWRRILDWKSAVVWAWFIAAIIQGAALFGINQAPPPLPMLIIISLISAGVCILPIVIIRLEIRRSFTRSRVIFGVLLGTILPVGLLTVFFLIQNAPVMILLYYSLYFFTLSIPFALLLIFNSWARDVTTGALFQKTA